MPLASTLAGYFNVKALAGPAVHWGWVVVVVIAEDHLALVRAQEHPRLAILRLLRAVPMPGRGLRERIPVCHQQPLVLRKFNEPKVVCNFITNVNL